MPVELAYLQRMLGSVSVVWVTVAYLSGLMIALLFRPERVYNWTLFKFACVLLALSLLLPPMLRLVFDIFQFVDGGPIYPIGTRSPSESSSHLLYSLTTLTGPLLEGLSILCAMFALMPSGRRQACPEPPRHPLEH